MVKYALKRIAYMFLTLFAIATITFFLMRSIPGDPLASMARTLPEQTKANYYAKYGLDKPLFTQYLLYMKGLVTFDLGESIVFPGRSVAGEIARTSPVSASVGGTALIIGTLIGVFLGVIELLRKINGPTILLCSLPYLALPYRSLCWHRLCSISLR